MSLVCGACCFEDLHFKHDGSVDPLHSPRQRSCRYITQGLINSTFRPVEFDEMSKNLVLSEPFGGIQIAWDHAT